MAFFKKNDQWYIDYYYDGKRLRELVGPSFKLAEEVLAKRKTQIAEHKFFPERGASKTFKDMIDKYWKLHAKFFKSKSWNYCRIELEKTFGDKFLDKISTTDIQEYYNNIRQRASVSTANRHLTLIKAIFNKAKFWKDYFKDNPCIYVSKAKEPIHRLRYLNQEEIASLIASCNERLQPLVLCALLTGMRRSELLNLDWSNVSLERGIIYLLRTKSGKPREIPIGAKLHEIFVKIHAPNGNVFGMTAPMLRRDFEKATKAAKIMGFRFHDLRHTYASHFIMRTNDLPALQALLGHSNPAMTQRYAHLSKGHLASEIAIFESFMPNLEQKTEENVIFDKNVH